jgi:membrane-associated phospholipid phosphatase
VLDFIFKYATVLGEGSFYAVFVILLFVYRLGPAIHSLLTILISTVIVQTLKNTVFHQWPRPIKYLGENAGFHLVDGIDINFINTFPSGHTATGFCISGVIVVITLGFAKEGRNAIQVLAFLFALLVGLSRVYLMQHFFVDILFGAIVGSFSAFVSYFLLLKWSYYNNYCLADKSIIDFWKK